MFSNILLTKNQVGLVASGSADCTGSNIKILNSRGDNIQVTGGVSVGELRLMGVQAQNAGFENTGTDYVNMRLTGSDTNTVVENYFSELSLSVANYGGRKYAIASITDNGNGKTRITTTVPHEMAKGFDLAGLEGTDNYDGTDFVVVNVISPTVLDLFETFTLGETTGNLIARGWDLLIEAQDLPQNVNDQFFSNCNINTVKLDGGYNLEFTGSRTWGKNSFYIDNNVDSNMIHIEGTSRGRNAPDSTLPISVYGPGSADGWTEFRRIDDDGGFSDEAGLRMTMRMAYTADGVGANGFPVSYTEQSVYQDKVVTKVGGKIVCDARNTAIWLGDTLSRGIRVRRTGTVGALSNYIDIIAVDAGTPPQILAAGSDTDMDLLVYAKGTGNLRTNGNFRNNTDNTHDLGILVRRWAQAFIRTLRVGAGAVEWTSGTGSPEGVLAAVVGSIWTRTDGGAGTTLYVKETGTGNTGWVAK
jgi:hypothetical protein